MVSEVVIPVLDQTGGEIVVQKWLKAEGDQVREGDPVCEVETGKATVEIEAPAGGVLRRILIGEGQAVPALTVIALIADAGEALPDIDPFYRVIERPSLGPALAPVGPEQVQPPAPGGERRLSRAATIRVSPRAKRIAEEHGLDLSTVEGTGPNGRIVEEDVRRALEQLQAGAPSRVEQARTERVVRSWQTIPHFHMTTTVDLTRIVEAKARAKAGITYTDYIAAAVIETLKRHPRLNGHWKNDRLTVFSEVHLGLVIQTERGLITPVVRNSERLTLEELAAARERLVAQAHAGRLDADSAGEASFTISNIGPGQIDSFTAIISPPQVAILAVGSIKPRPIVVATALEIRPTATFTIGVDHRANDGRQAAAFLEDLKRRLESEW